MLLDEFWASIERSPGIDDVEDVQDWFLLARSVIDQRTRRSTVGLDPVKLESPDLPDGFQDPSDSPRGHQLGGEH